MIRVVTFAVNNEQGDGALDWQEQFAHLQRADIDILCCQGLWRSLDGSEDQASRLAESLGMPYNCFVAGSRQQGRALGKEQAVCGLAILAGAGMWMLNSGSIPVLGNTAGTKARVQFAHFRTSGTSVLVLNLQLSGSKQTKLLQLRTLFSHQLLKEKYGAVVLCGDQLDGLTANKLRLIAAGSNYTPHRDLMSEQCSYDEGTPCILTAKEQPVAAVTLCVAGLGQGAMPNNPGLGNRHVGFWLDFELERIPQGMACKSFLPMSFEEQWSGYKVKAAAVV